MNGELGAVQQNINANENDARSSTVFPDKTREPVRPMAISAGGGCCTSASTQRGRGDEMGPSNHEMNSEPGMKGIGPCIRSCKTHAWPESEDRDSEYDRVLTALELEILQQGQTANTVTKRRAQDNLNPGVRTLLRRRQQRGRDMGAAAMMGEREREILKFDAGSSFEKYISAVQSVVGLQPVAVFDGSTDGTGGFLPARLGPRASPRTGRVRDGLTRRRGTRSRPFDGFDGSLFLDGNLDQINSLAETSISTRHKHLDGIVETCRYLICDQIPINRLETLVWFHIRVFEKFYDTLDVLCSSTRQKRPLRTGRVGPARLGALSYPLTGIPVPSRKTAVFVTAIPFNGRVEALPVMQELCGARLFSWMVFLNSPRVAKQNKIWLST
ncbi:hypothetical protein DFH08DRAFT_1040236 [Mycena albidolilacea]|uniref:Uncharacterized protein n=1 Tax=Mycena albidolilacea TaxID=1033008 RepID=A0AAD6ZCK4_9AGAR|nr:hypothetical protein DFH08DRAFT_1040236 [Mycena albidolilacea]